VLLCKHGLENKSIVVSVYSLRLQSPGISGKKAVAQSVHLQQHSESLTFSLLSRSSEQKCSFVGKTATGTCKILENVYGNKVLSQLYIFELSEIFQQGCHDLENSSRIGRQSTA
jgi:predicted NACHT family NTPase